MCKLSQVRQTYYPKPPKSLATITGIQLRDILKPYGIGLRGPVDNLYGLPSKQDWLRFLVWYQANAPIKPSEYTQDDLDCDDFAWCMRAEALKWMQGQCVFGYIEASSIDGNYPFPMHAFCFFVDWQHHVYFVDPLEVAAGIADPEPAYEVQCQDVKA